MSQNNLKNLEKIGQLKPEPFDQEEYNGLVRSGKTRFKDANNTSLSQESRFDLAYNAAHSLALAALRKHGFRSVNRYVVFQALPHTLKLGNEYTRVLDTCHSRRNVSEYEGYLDVDEKLLNELLKVIQIILEKMT
jgi:hypothetical protein